MNDVPFGWSSDYEVAVVYITSAWTEFGDVRSSAAPLGIIAENGFLNYCVRFKTKLAAWTKSVSILHTLTRTILIIHIYYITLWIQCSLYNTRLRRAYNPFTISRRQYVFLLESRTQNI